MKTLEVNLLKDQDSVELTDEQLSTISGGVAISLVCPKCGSSDIIRNIVGDGNYAIEELNSCSCNKCGHRFYIEK